MICWKQRKDKKYLITVPFDLAGFKGGDEVDIDDFCQALNDTICDLRDQVYEREGRIDDLIDEIDDLHYQIENFYRPISGYKLNGVRRSDYEGVGCYG